MEPAAASRYLCITKITEMAVKKTIAIIGASGQTGAAIANKLAAANCRLLLLSNGNDESSQLSNYIKGEIPGAEVEVTDCVKDGCWEADIIFLPGPYQKDKEAIEKVREVATQKIVVCFSNPGFNTSFVPHEAGELQRSLPYSKVVAVFNDPLSMEAFLTGDDGEAVEIIAGILRTAGYHLSGTGHLSFETL